MTFNQGFKKPLPTDPVVKKEEAVTTELWDDVYFQNYSFYVQSRINEVHKNLATIRNDVKQNNFWKNVKIQV